ncbi:MAG TPA: DUF4912 domain-containing protein [Allocoleopsis sp.]
MSQSLVKKYLLSKHKLRKDNYIQLIARSPEQVQVCWQISGELKQIARRQGGQRLTLRIYDVTDIDLNLQVPHSVQQVSCDEAEHERSLQVPESGEYIAELGYDTPEGRWLRLVRSPLVQVPRSELRSN